MKPRSPASPAAEIPDNPQYSKVTPPGNATPTYYECNYETSMFNKHKQV